MAILTGKMTHFGQPSKLLMFPILLVAVTFLFIIASITSVNPLNMLASDPSYPVHTKTSCPIIVYNKQIKTGSTVLANVLYRTTEAHGCRNSGCRLHQLLMNGNSSHIGAINGLTLTCHAQEKNPNIINHLRTTHGKSFAYIASVREPIGWFKSAACFFYRQKVDSSVRWTDEGFKTVIDWFLQPENYEPLEEYLFGSLGLTPRTQKRDIMSKLLMYDLIIDHARMDEGLEELGTLLGWKMLPPSQGKSETYRGALYNTYRTEEIKKMTSKIATLYSSATEIRDLQRERPAFAIEEAPKVVDE